MKDRPAAKDDRVRNRDGQTTIWVPPGARLVTSENVRAVPMAQAASSAPVQAETPVEPRTRARKISTATDLSRLRREAKPKKQARTAPTKVTPAKAAPAKAAPAGPWQKPANWSDLAGPPKENWSDDPASLSVPPEIDAMAQVVMGHYKMSVSGMKLITTKPDKGGAIWRIETDKGPRSLKLLHRDAPRSLFSIGAQDYLVSRGARVPALVRTTSGDMCVMIDGKMWIVTDWIEPLTPASKVDLAGAQALCYGLGEFHRLSQGYVPPPGAYNATRLRRWPKAYGKVRTKMGWFRDLAQAYSETPAAPVILELVDTFEQQARDALTRLERSAYAELVERGEQHFGIVHQDYGWSNGQIGPDGIWIIDLDGVAYDLPIRDLRKLITSTMDDMGNWDVTWMRGMIDAYTQANPIEPDLYEILLIDMALPNEFYKHVKEIVQDPLLHMNGELAALLRRLQQSDQSKWLALSELGLGPIPKARPARSVAKPAPTAAPTPKPTPAPTRSSVISTVKDTAAWAVAQFGQHVPVPITRNRRRGV